MVRILLVEDHPRFRDLIRSQTQQRPELQIIAEVTDGLEAIQRAKELQPDLIILDIGLPTVSGFEVARRASTVAPGSRVIFVTTETSDEFVRIAFEFGALGYVHKAEALELLQAIDAALRGDRYLSSKLANLTSQMRIHPCPTQRSSPAA